MRALGQGEARSGGNTAAQAQIHSRQRERERPSRNFHSFICNIHTALFLISTPSSGSAAGSAPSLTVGGREFEPHPGHNHVVVGVARLALGLACLLAVDTSGKILLRLGILDVPRF